MRLLCIDCGNTRIKWGLREAKAWRAQGAVPVSQADQLDTQVPESPTRAVACNVAGATVRNNVESLAQRWAIPVHWVEAQARQSGVHNGYSRPNQLGADRWAALIGAWQLQHGPCVVVSAGTATTIDLLDGSGQFRGGLILPGLALMQSALATRTADLPLAQGRYCDVPRNTDDAIVSGCLHATLGAIERMFHLLDDAQARCVLTGGAAAQLEPLLSLPARRVDNLVLEGLASIEGA
jgi:type III pantothenate kinase